MRACDGCGAPTSEAELTGNGPLGYCDDCSKDVIKHQCGGCVGGFDEVDLTTPIGGSGDSGMCPRCVVRHEVRLLVQLLEKHAKHESTVATVRTDLYDQCNEVITAALNEETKS